VNNYTVPFNLRISTGRGEGGQCSKYFTYSRKIITVQTTALVAPYFATAVIYSCKIFTTLILQALRPQISVPSLTFTHGLNLQNILQL